MSETPQAGYIENTGEAGSYAVDWVVALQPVPEDAKEGAEPRKVRITRKSFEQIYEARGYELTDDDPDELDKKPAARRRR